MGARTIPAPAADVLACIGFFTRIPAPATDRPFSRALWAAPLAGALVGVLAGLVLLLALAAGLPAAAAAALALGAAILATGALHEDGLADVADGFGGGRDRERKLVIMRDSRIGSYGTLALILSLMLRWSALAALSASPSGAFMALLAAHGASRALLPAFMARVPPARTDGLSAGVSGVGARTASLALALGMLALLALGLYAAAIAAIALAAAFAGFERLCRRQIGGQTGDVLGALQQAAETAVLLVAAALLT